MYRGRCNIEDIPPAFAHRIDDGLEERDEIRAFILELALADALLADGVEDAEVRLLVGGAEVDDEAVIMDHELAEFGLPGGRNSY